MNRAKGHTGNGDSSRNWPVDLLAWYDASRREMPWRGHADPYAVWVSEIMLQQTQVETVRGYFVRFLERFPTVAALAYAPQESVLKAWEGLGYYSRARNLQRAAQAVVAGGGQLPSDVAGWQALPGVGEYTAAAIASICFNVTAPVVDGNVARVFARFLGLDDDFRKPSARAGLAAWLQPHIVQSGRPGDFNQAMMDLGATVCTPRAPACTRCPLMQGCFAEQTGRQADFPCKPPKKAVPVRESVALLVRDGEGRVLLVRRSGGRLLEGLWELPNGPVSGRPAAREARRVLKDLTGLDARRVVRGETVAHAFSHFKQQLHVFEVRGCSGDLAARNGATLRFARPDELPLTTVARRVVSAFG